MPEPAAEAPRQSEGERRHQYAHEHGARVDEIGPCGRCHTNLTIRYGPRARILCETCQPVRPVHPEATRNPGKSPT